MGTFLSSVVIQWLFRRFLEVGGIVGTLLTAWGALPPELQDTVLAFLTAKWETVTLGSLIPVIVTVWGYVWSFISTKRNQVVIDGQQVPLKEIQQTPQKTAVEEMARTAIQKRGKTLMEMLAEKIGRR